MFFAVDRNVNVLACAVIFNGVSRSRLFYFFSQHGRDVKLYANKFFWLILCDIKRKRIPFMGFLFSKNIQVIWK